MPPEIYCDLNARMTENGYSVETCGSVADLAKLGLTLEKAVGRCFTFNGGSDVNENGEPSDIMFSGVIVKDPEWGYLAVSDAAGIYWRSTQVTPNQSFHRTLRDKAAPRQ